ncbi:DeoR/GlpR family DNA-binding transcription regulator [Asticcacaulis sp. W401b]|uniref:DeoR/GlpR family DNA-binding transcription regulator n=1 Tax=Asticcacaulis sp. W401b TaxID=3388666 RepID=UPI0039708E55
MHLQDRWKRVLAELAPNAVTPVDTLTEKLGVSPATIRRDLNELHDLGHLIRVRGGAMPSGSDTFAKGEGQSIASGRLSGQALFTDAAVINAAAKRAIGRAALKYLRPNMSIIIDGGSTTHAFAAAMGDEAYNVLTPSIPILHELLERSRVRITVPGGELFREQRIVLNPYEDSLLRSFSAEAIFIGCQSLTRNGLMQSDTLLVQSERRLIERAEKVIVLADSSKIDAPSALSVCPLTDIDVLFTDDGINPDALTWLQGAGIEVQIITQK